MPHAPRWTSRPPTRWALAWVTLAWIALAAAPQAQTASGFVEDARTGERLVGATVYDAARHVGTATNGFGFFALPLGDADAAGVVVRYLGYAPLDTVLAASGSPVTLRLEPAAEALGPVTVEADDVRAGPAGSVRLTAAEVERLPALLGEADPLKALQLTPSVRAGAEGSSGLHVRGGSPDQTLLLLDGAPVYNAAHAAGAVSVFNADALQSVLLIPGAPPARYGGRLSAVVDVTTREGSRARPGGTATVGLLASRALVERPIAGGRGSVLVAGRRTYADLLARPLLFEDGAAAGYAFADGTAKVNVDLDDRTRLFVSAYGGADRFYARSSETFEGSQRTETTSTEVRWGNVTATARATRALSGRAFLSGLAYVSRYDFDAERAASETYPAGSGRPDRSAEFRQGSGLRDLAARADLALALGRHAVEVGASVERRAFRPSADAPAAVGTWGGAAYLGDAVRVGPRAAVEAGLRWGWLAAGGRLHTAAQPRLSATVEAGPWTALASAGRTWQPLHLLTNPGVGLPTDLWVPATADAPPASAWQGALGVERALGPRWEGSASVFAKALSGLVEYRDGAGFFGSSERWEDAVTTGGGRAYGLEVALARTGGATDVQVAYALSRSERAFPAIDGGRTFPYRYDRTHDLSLVVTRHLSARRRLTVLVVYGTGAAVTVPVGRFGPGAFGTNLVYGPRNGGRLPAYHRADVSYEVTYGRGRLALGLYNVYNRLNPFYVTYETRYDERRARDVDGVRGVALFPVLPSVSYRFGL